MDYTLLEYAIDCADFDDLSFCYEAVRDDFFDDIAGGGGL